MAFRLKMATALLLALLFVTFSFESSLIKAVAAPVTSETSLDYVVNGQVHTLIIKYPTSLETKTSCATFPVTVSTPSASIRPDVDLQAYLVFLEDPLVEPVFFSTANNTWNTKSATSTLNLKVCNLDISGGVSNQVEIGFMVVSNKGGGLEFVDHVSDYLKITGAAPTSQIACVKGSKAVVVTATNPKCPAGFTKSNIPVVNGKLRTTTITCVKGLSLKKVTGVFPSCPSGFRRQ